jgi:hypothetical protein
MPRRIPGAASRLACAVLISLAGLPAGGCALLPFGGGPTAAAGGGPSSVPDLRDFRVAFHCHSLLSHDSKVPFERIARVARELGFSAVILDDHYQPGNIARSPHGLLDGVLFVTGVELRPRIPGCSPGTGGSLLVFGIDQDFDASRPTEELTRDLRERGALAVWGHAEEPSCIGIHPYDAMEVYNLHAQFKAAHWWSLALGLLFLPSNQFYQSQVEPDASVIRFYDAELRRGKRLPPLGGHDAHENIRLFGPLGGTLGAYPDLLRLFSNHVLAPDLSGPSIIDGIRRGRVYLCFDFLGDGTGFSMAYGGGAAPPPAGESPAPAAGLGDVAAFRADAVLTVHTPAAGKIRIIHDGAAWKETRGDAFSGALPGPGVWRVEVYRRGFWGNDRLWILSAPIYLEDQVKR